MKLQLLFILSTVIVSTVQVNPRRSAFDHQLAIRCRRDLQGAFDAFRNGVLGLKNGVRQVGASVTEALRNIFSQNNFNALRNGVINFKTGVRDGLRNLFTVPAPAQPAARQGVNRNG